MNFLSCWLFVVVVFLGCCCGFFWVFVLILIGVWWLVLEVGSGFGLMGSNFSSDFAREIFRL